MFYMTRHNSHFFSLKEPIQTSGYICNFEDLEIKSVLLDEILKVTTNNTPSMSAAALTEPPVCNR
jgi:hypothetical protein